MRILIKNKEKFIEMFNQSYPTHKINKINGISIDSRAIKTDDIFVAIKGETYDGNNYVDDAIKKGAIKCFSERNKKHKNIINVPSTKDTVNKLSKKWKNLSNHKIIGITGSNGKTTLKDLLHKILSEKYKCSKSEGNYNSSIGLPLTYLSTNINDEYCVLEYGANKKDEIQYLCSIIKPDYSVITNISKAHIKNFGTIKTTLKTKSAIFKCLKENDTAVINLDDENIASIKFKSKKITTSFTTKSDYCFKNNASNNFIVNKNKLMIKNELMHIKSLISLAYSLSKELEVNHKSIVKSINDFDLQIGRGGKVVVDNIEIIDDCYNANPSSVKLAINRFENLQNKGKKILILGDMKELGEHSKKEHSNIANILNKTNIDIILTYGISSIFIYKKLNDSFLYKNHFNKKTELKNELIKNIKDGDLIYIKGSRSNQLETLYKEGLR